MAGKRRVAMTVAVEHEALACDALADLTRDAGRELRNEPCGEGRVEVRETDEFRWMHFGDAALQSVMRRAAPADPVMPNHGLMLAALLFVDTPKRLLNLGLDGGVFERFFRAHLPDLEVITVEKRPVVIRLARDCFGVAADHPIIECSAEEYLATTSATHDIILADLFDGERHAACVGDEHFQAHAAAALQPGGVLALNLSPTSQDDLLATLLAVRRHFEWVWMAGVTNHGNVVLLATNGPPLSATELAARAARWSDRLAFDLRDAAARLTRLPVRPES